MRATAPGRKARPPTTEGLSMASGQRRGEEGQPLRGLRAPDLRDLAVAIARQALLVAPEIVVEVLDLLMRLGAGDGRVVQDVELGALGREELADLRDGGLLLLAERSVFDALLLVLLAEALHGQLIRALRALIGHAASVAEGPGSLSHVRTIHEQPEQSGRDPSPEAGELMNVLASRRRWRLRRRFSGGAAPPARVPRCRARTPASIPGRPPSARRAAGEGTRAGARYRSRASPASDPRRRARVWRACGRGFPRAARWAAW